MIIPVDQNTLLKIAGDIQRNCDLLSATWGEYVEDDVSLYVPMIRRRADELAALAQLSTNGDDT